MSTISTTGRILYLDLENSKVIFELEFLTPELVDELVTLFESEDSTLLHFKSKKRERLLSAQQRKQFWIDLFKIMRALQIPKNPENCRIFYYDVIKKNIFPVKYRTLGDNSYPYIPEMKELRISEMSEIIQRQRDTYENLNIDWDN